MEMFGYDCEIFPNYALFRFFDVGEYIKVRDNMPTNINVIEFEKQIREVKHITFHIGLGVNDINKLVSFVNRNIILASFNGLDYDDVLLSACIAKVNYWKTLSYINEQLYSLSKRIIYNQNNHIYNDDVINSYRRMRTFFKSVDVQKVFGLNKVFKSLKQTLINLKWYNIEDYEMPAINDKDKHFYKPKEIPYIQVWDRYVIPEYLEGIYNYCGNDTLGVCEIVYQKIDDITYRFDASIKYGVSLLSSSKSNIADKIFGKLYCDASGLDFWEYQKGRTERDFVDIGDCIDSKIRFIHEDLKLLLHKLKHTRIYNTKGDINFPFTFGGANYKIATGGLHSVDLPAKFSIDDDSELIDCDVDSFYPRVILNKRISPEHLNADIFIGTTTNIVDDRINAKKSKDKTTADTLKIVLNAGMFGKMGFDESPIKDIKAMVGVTINGQLYLVMLIEALVRDGFKVISANTDGIITIVPKDKKDMYIDICTRWCKYLNFTVEYTYYELYIRRDVNNYMAVKIGSDPVTKRVKYKGVLNPLLYKEDLTKSYRNPIVAQAVNNYYLFDKSIMDTLTESTDIMDFCSTQKPGGDFIFELHRNIGGIVDIYKLTKDVRFYVSKNRQCINTGVLVKNNFTKQEHTLGKYGRIVAGKTVTIFNRKIDYDNIEDYNIDYGYYYAEAKKVITAIESNTTNKLKIKKEYGQYDLGLFK